MLQKIIMEESVSNIEIHRFFLMAFLNLFKSIEKHKKKQFKDPFDITSFKVPLEN